MNTRKVLAVLVVASVVLFKSVGSVRASEQVESSADDTPIKLIDAVQGSCGKHELSTERGCVTPPHITKKVQPRFPKPARREQVQGKVVLGAIVETDGTVGPVKVIDSTRPGQGFEESAIEAVKKWRYKPGRLGDVPVRIYFTVTIDFTYR